MNEQCDDVRIALPRDRLTAGHPIIDLRIALVEQALELAQLLIRELGEMLICDWRQRTWIGLAPRNRQLDRSPNPNMKAAAEMVSSEDPAPRGTG
jgi:hypothetical protein